MMTTFNVPILQIIDCMVRLLVGEQIRCGHQPRIDQRLLDPLFVDRASLHANPVQGQLVRCRDLDPRSLFR